MDFKITKIKKFLDDRGELIEFIKGSDKEILGTFYYISFKTHGTIRASHYHKKKIEYFSVIAGSCKVTIEDINTKENKTFTLTSGNGFLDQIMIGPSIAHKFESIEKGTILLAYGSTLYDHNNPDTYDYKFKG